MVAQVVHAQYFLKLHGLLDYSFGLPLIGSQGADDPRNEELGLSQLRWGVEASTSALIAFRVAAAALRQAETAETEGTANVWQRVLPALGAVADAQRPIVFEREAGTLTYEDAVSLYNAHVGKGLSLTTEGVPPNKQ